jgi:hypothetical protein
VAHFPFKNNMSFVVMVPTHFEWNVSQVLANLSWDTLHQPSLREKPTKVRLPKLHLKHQLDLVATLSQLGKEVGHGRALGGAGQVDEERLPAGSRSESWRRGYDMILWIFCPGVSRATQGIGTYSAAQD